MVSGPGHKPKAPPILTMSPQRLFGPPVRRNVFLYSEDGSIRILWKVGTAQLKRDGKLWRTGGEVKGKLVNWVGIQYSSHYLRTWCIQHYYRWCAHLGCQYSTAWRPCRFKWTRPFRRKTKSGFCACAITFQKQSTCYNACLWNEATMWWGQQCTGWRKSLNTHVYYVDTAVGWLMLHPIQWRKVIFRG